MTQGAAAQLWRDGNYVCYRTSRAVSLLGSSISSLAYPLLVLSMSGSAVQAGAVGTCVALGRLSFQLYGGQLADRFDPRRLMVSMDVLRLVTVGSIPVAGALDRLTFWHILAMSLVSGAAGTISSSGDMVLLRALIPSKLFSLATSQAQVASGTMVLLGPVLGGALYSFDRMLPFIVDASSFAIAAVLLIAISARQQQTTANKPAAGRGGDRRVTAGMRWLWTQKDLMLALSFSSVFNLVGVTAGVAAIVIMKLHGVSSGVIGIVMACDGGAVIVGALIARWIVTWGLTGLLFTCGLIWVASLATTATAPSSPWIIGAAITLMSLIAPATGVLMSQLLRDRAPENLFGRVTAAQRLLASSLVMAGPLLAGVLTTAIGPTYLWLCLAGVCLIITALATAPHLLTRRATITMPPDQTTVMAGQER
jgi:MFS family permease